MMLQSKLERLRDALTAIEGLTVYHYWRFVDEPKVCIWQEDSEASALQADFRKEEQAIGGTVDYFTHTEYDPMVDSIQTAMNGIESCLWNLDDVMYEEETNYIHYSWRWRLL